jgi:hypothetical protein
MMNFNDYHALILKGYGTISAVVVFKFGEGGVPKQA